MTDRPALATPTVKHAAKLEAVAFGLLAVVPLGMALQNRSALLLTVLAALAALAAALWRGALTQAVERAARALATPLGLVCCLFLAVALISISRSHHVGRSLSAYGEFLLACAAPFVLHAALPRRIPGWAIKLAAIVTAIGCLLIVVELASGMSMRLALGLRADSFIFKRSVTAILMVAWPLAIILWLRRQAPIGVALLVLVALASLAASSTGALLGLVAGSGLALVAAASRRAAAAVLAAGLVAMMAIAPVLGDVAGRWLSERSIERLAFAHARERLDIWQGFGEVARRRIVFGTGFGTSPVMAQQPVAAEVPAERRAALTNWHPHNAYLQVWVELGAAGAILVAAALLLLCRALARLDRWRGVAATAIVASAATILTVGHGAWQGWWAAVVGAAIVWLRRMPPSPDQASGPAPVERPRKPVART